MIPKKMLTVFSQDALIGKMHGDPGVLASQTLTLGVSMSQVIDTRRSLPF